MFRGIEQARGFLREIDLAGAARNLRQFLQSRLDPAADGRIASAGGIDQARGKSFFIIDQDLEQMLGDKLLMALAKGQTSAPTG